MSCADRESFLEDEERFQVLDGVMIVATAPTWEAAQCAKEMLEQEGYEELEIQERNDFFISDA